jgi:hypothetical protein
MDTWTTNVYGVETESIEKLDIDKCVDFAIENNKELKEKVEKVLYQYPPYDRRDIKRELTTEFYDGLYSSQEEDAVYAGICEDIERTLGLDGLSTTYMLVEHNDEGAYILGLLPIYPHLESKEAINTLTQLTAQQVNDAFKETFKKLGVTLTDDDINEWNLTNWA